MCTALVSSGPLYYSGSYFSATLSSSATDDQYGRCLLPPHAPVPATSFSMGRFQTCSALVSAPGWKRNGVLKTSPTPTKDQRSEGKKEGDRIFQQVWPGGVLFNFYHLHRSTCLETSTQKRDHPSPSAEAVPVYQVQAGTPTLMSLTTL